MGVICLCGMSPLLGQQATQLPQQSYAQMNAYQAVYQHLGDQPAMARQFLRLFHQIDQLEQQLQQAHQLQNLQKLRQHRTMLWQKVKTFKADEHGELSFSEYVGTDLTRLSSYGKHDVRR